MTRRVLVPGALLPRMTSDLGDPSLLPWAAPPEACVTSGRGHCHLGVSLTSQATYANWVDTTGCAQSLRQNTCDNTVLSMAGACMFAVGPREARRNV